MTRTEERLAAALRETARTIGEGSLPPLVVPAGRRVRWARRLAPVAAAAAVALIAVLAVVLPGVAHKPPSGTPLPRYYVVLRSDGPIEVRATSTGAVTDTVPYPPGSWSAADVAAAGDGRFIAEFLNFGGGKEYIRLYSFRLAAGGRVTGFSLVKGGVLDRPTVMLVQTGYGSALAVSPDGSRVALSACVTFNSSGYCESGIIVVNLRTGSHQVWAGGLGQTQLGLMIPAISWAGDGRSLVFLTLRCALPTCPFFVLQQPTHAQLRTLSLASPGRSLAQGRVLLGESARYPDIVQAELAPGGAAIAVAVLRPPSVFHTLENLQVILVPLASGQRPRLLYQGRLVYQGRLANALQMSLSPDASGRHWLLATGSNGWIGGGRLHLLPPQGGRVWNEVWG